MTAASAIVMTAAALPRQSKPVANELKWIENNSDACGRIASDKSPAA